MHSTESHFFWFKFKPLKRGYHLSDRGIFKKNKMLMSHKRTRIKLPLDVWCVVWRAFICDSIVDLIPAAVLHHMRVWWCAVGFFLETHAVHALSWRARFAPFSRASYCNFLITPIRAFISKRRGHFLFPTWRARIARNTILQFVRVPRTYLFV